MADSAEIEERVKTFILEEFLVGELPSNLTGSTPLASAGILDSLATLRLVDFLEQQFSVVIEPDDVQPANFDTIDDIVRLVRSKQDH